MNVRLRRCFAPMLAVIIVVELIVTFRNFDRRKTNSNYMRDYSTFENEERLYREQQKNVKFESLVLSKQGRGRIQSENPKEATKSPGTIRSVQVIQGISEESRRYISNKQDDRGKRKDYRGKINIYYYPDICTDYDNYALLWNKLFPYLPVKFGLSSLEDNIILTRRISRRIIGFIMPLKTDYYEFEISSKGGCELIIIDQYDTFSQSETIDKFMLRFGIYKNEIISRAKLKSIHDIYTIRSNKTILMKKGQKYLFDFTNPIPINGRLVIKWRHKNETAFHIIPSSVLSPFDPNVNTTLANVNITLPKIHHLQKTSQTKLLETNRRNLFNKIKILNKAMTMETCEYNKPSYIPNIVQEGHGVGYVKLDLLYPYDNMIANHIKDAPVIFMEKERADYITQKYMNENLVNYTVQDIVHIEENKEDTAGKRYFIEVDVKSNNDKEVYRSSGWMFIHNNGSICTPNGYTWNAQEKIYLLTPVRNQFRWIKYLIQSLNDVVVKTDERNIHLIMVDYNSTDVDIEDVLKTSLFPYTLIKERGKFSKVKGLNLAVKSIKEEDALMFIFDLHLQFPTFLFDYIRKHTFRSKTTYVPILLRTHCGQHPEFTKLTRNSIWQEIGYGMISIFKSDWIKVGGMDEKQFADKWGGEDWDLVERIIKHKLEVIHHRLPGYYHLYHSNKGTWDGSKA